METDSKTKSRKIIIDSDEEDNRPTEATISNTPISNNNGSVNSQTIPSQKERKQRSTKKKNTIEDVEKYCFDVINEMKDFFKKDLQLNEQQKPAHYKIENVDRICSKIIRKDVQQVFVSLGILKELRTWLEPLPDNTLPNQKIKKAILDLLSYIKVNKSDLINSGIGKIIHFYSKNSKEALEIRRIATSIMKKWKAKIIREEY